MFSEDTVLLMYLICIICRLFMTIIYTFPPSLYLLTLDHFLFWVLFIAFRIIITFCCYSVANSCPTLRHYRLQHARLPCPSPFPGVCTNSCSLSWWCHPTISSSVVTFSSCLQSFPPSGSFPMSWIFPSGASVSVPVLPMNIQGWFLLRLTGLISLQSKGLSKQSSSEPPFESINSLVDQPSFWSTSHIHTWLPEKS